MVESLTTEKRSGHDMDLLEDPPNDLLCLLCHALASDPQLTSCDCAQLYCRACLERLTESSSQCQKCKLPLRAFPDTLSAQRIAALGVKCSAEMNGCGQSAVLGQPRKRQSSLTEPHCQDARGYPGVSTAASRRHHRTSQKMEGTETRDDVLMLHVPFLVVCFMIVCITLSSCIMGYI